MLDIISRGRVAYVLGIGHRPEEYEHFGLGLRGRGARADEQLRDAARAASGRTGHLAGTVDADHTRTARAEDRSSSSAAEASPPPVGPDASVWA